MNKKLLLVGLLLAAPIYADQQLMASSLINPFTIGIVSGAIFTAGTLLLLQAQAERTFLRHTVIGLVRMQDDIQGLDRILAELDYYVDSNQFFGVLLLINSSGGSFGTAAALHREILLRKNKKPIVAFIENSCCAAAYYVASACDFIAASPCAEVGSIGVLYPHAYLDSTQYYMLEGSGIMQGTWQPDGLQAGAYKMAQLPMRPMNDEERQMEQNFIDDIYNTMCSDIALARDLDITTSDLWANGKLFTAHSAAAVGLVDVLGSLAQTKSALLQLFKDRRIQVPGKIVLLEKKTQSWFSTMQTMFEKTLGNQAQSNIRSPIV